MGLPAPFTDRRSGRGRAVPVDWFRFTPSTKRGGLCDLDRRRWPKVGCSGPMALDEKLPDLRWNMSGRTISRQIGASYAITSTFRPYQCSKWVLFTACRGVRCPDCILNTPGYKAVELFFFWLTANKRLGTVFVFNFCAVSWDAFRCAAGSMLYCEKEVSHQGRILRKNNTRPICARWSPRWGS